MIAQSRDIKFECSQCGQHIVVDQSGAGLAASCPICETPVIVPHASAIHDRNYSGEIRSADPGEREHDSKRPPFADPGPEEIRDELFDAAVENGRLEREVDEAKGEMARLQALFKKAVDECERLTANATHAHAEIKSFHSDRQQLKSDLAQTRQRAQAAESQLAEVRAKAEELATALGSLSAENAGLREQIENDLSLSHARVAATETQLQIRERDLRDAKAEATEVVQALAAAEAELSTLRAEACGLRRESESAQSLLDEAGWAAQHLATREQELQIKLQAATEETRRLSAERDQLRGEAEGLRRDLSAADTGRELLDLRDRVPRLEGERDRTAADLAEQIEKAKTLAATEQRLLTELHESVLLREDADRRAQAASEHQIKKDNEVLRGIIERQNETLRVHHIEVRGFRRSRYALRILYVCFGLGLIALALFAIAVFATHGLGGLLKSLS